MVTAAGVGFSENADSGRAGREAARAAMRARRTSSSPRRAASATSDVPSARSSRWRPSPRELASALGLGGRDREATSSAQRARINVTRTITSVIDRIAQAHPELGRHLAASVPTGMFCSYSTEASHPALWDVS